MSCIATSYITNEADYAVVLALAKRIHKEQKGWWIFKKNVEIGRTEFESAFNSKFNELTTLNYSGYTMLEIEGIAQNDKHYAIPENNNSSKDLELIFGYGGYILRNGKMITVPSDDYIAEHLRGKGQDYRADAIGAVRSAYEFYNKAAGAVKNGSVVLIGLY